MPHDIIDNRHQKLVDNINQILHSAEAAHFAVGYFFLSGFTAVAPRLRTIQRMRLLIGNTSNRETIEQLAEGYRRLELIKDHLEAQEYPKRTASKQMAGETAANIRSGVELMAQTDEAEALVKNHASLTAWATMSCPRKNSKNPISAYKLREQI